MSTLDYATPLQPSVLRRYLLLALLYFSEGAPIGYIWWALPSKLRAAGMPVEQVAALTALLTVPWTFKFLWAPAVDALQTPRFGVRGWITVMQILMGLTLLPLAILPLSSVLFLATALLISHAICAATQDVAIDALAIGILEEHERGKATGWMQTGMLAARAIFGGGALYLERYVGERVIIIALIAAIWLALIALWTMGVRPVQRDTHGRPIATFGQHLFRAIISRRTWLGIGIAVFAGAGFEAVGGLAGPMLIDHGLSKESVGLFLAFPVVGFMILGAITGGFLTDRLGARRMAAFGIVGCAAWVGLLAFVLETDANGWLIAGFVAPIYLFIGVLTAASYALLMNLTDPAIAGTQFSTFMGATNLCEVWSIFLAGTLAAQGYTLAFLVAAALSLLTLPLLLLLPRDEVNRT